MAVAPRRGFRDEVQEHEVATEIGCRTYYGLRAGRFSLTLPPEDIIGAVPI